MKKTRKVKGWAVIESDDTIMANIERHRLFEIYETRVAAKSARGPIDEWEGPPPKVVPCTIEYTINTSNKK